MYPYLFLAFLQASSPQAVSLVEDCSEPERAIASLTPADDVQVQSSIAGGAQACYSVTAIIDGKRRRGFVLGRVLPAITAYEQQRIPVAAPERVLETNVPSPAPAATTEAATLTPQEEKPRLPAFADFSASDMRGRPVSLRGLTGKVVLVCFWSPLHDPSQRELLVVSRLFAQFHRQGLDAAAISLSSDRSKIRESLEEFGITMPVISNDSGIAARYGLSYAVIPITYVLNEKHEIVASGVHGNALESIVQKLMRAR